MNNQTLSWNSDGLAQFAPKNKVDEVDLTNLLKGRKFGQKQVEQNFDMCPSIPQYDLQDMRELEEYCQRRGIVGVNLNNMNPRAVLAMLKAKSGERTSITETTKRTLLNG